MNSESLGKGILAGLTFTFILLIYFIYKALKSFIKQRKYVSYFEGINYQNFESYFPSLNNIELQRQILAEIKNKSFKKKQNTNFLANKNLTVKEIETAIDSKIYWTTFVDTLEKDSYSVLKKKFKEINNENRLSENSRILLNNLESFYDEIATKYRKNSNKSDGKYLTYIYLLNRIEERNFLV